MDMDNPKPTRTREDTPGGRKAEPDGSDVLIVDMMRTLLADQHAAILDAQQKTVTASVQEAIHNLEKSQERRFDAIDKTTSDQGALATEERDRRTQQLLFDLFEEVQAYVEPSVELQVLLAPR